LHFVRTVRFIFVVACVVAGIAICGRIYDQTEMTLMPVVLSGVAGLFIGLLVVYAESQLRTSFPPKTVLVGLVGLALGLLTAYLLYQMLNIQANETVNDTARVILYTLFGYLGTVLALRYSDRVDLSHTKIFAPTSVELRGAKILDSSVIIDGRIADVLETGFVEGPILLPQFVIEEIQGIADSSQSARRKRGRRGLDMIKRMQNTDTSFRVVEEDFPEIPEVDSKLVALAKQYGASVVTNDYNLNKVAQIHDVSVLNINDLAGSLRPVVMPDEELRVTIVKPGKEDLQGVGYLEDGTMVVVERGVDYMNETVDITVTRVLQTAAGRMIFGRVQNGRRER
jgi:uncharacterized protein YacL